MLSVSIVVYKPDVELLCEVLSSVQLACKAAKLSREMFHVDILNNHMEDNLPERLDMLPAWRHLSKDLPIRIIRSGGNIGYGAANNISLLTSARKYHLVLNPDAILEEDTLVKAFEHLEKTPTTSLVSPQVHGFDGELHHLCKLNPTLFDLFLRSFSPGFIKGIFKQRMARFEMRDRDYNREICPLPFPTGCFMLFRTLAVQSIGGFDPTYFMHMEDADIGRRINQISNVVYLPQVKIKHKWARGSHRSLFLRFVTIQSAFIYYRKWGGLF